MGTAADRVIILGGAANVLEDYHLAQQFGPHIQIIAVNDMIAEFRGRIQCAASLHADKLCGWISQRTYRKLNKPDMIWSTGGVTATHTTKDWGGSSGLFAVKVAIEMGYEKIILCGVPMHVDGNHILRKIPWHACNQFQWVWNYRQHEINNRVRSMSGYTRELLGAPTKEWLCS